MQKGMIAFLGLAFSLTGSSAAYGAGDDACERAVGGAASPPVADRRPHEMTHHGDTRTDYYHWLRDDRVRKDGTLDPEIRAYLDAENAYTEAQTAHTAALQQTLFDEYVARIDEDDTSAPTKIGEYYYYTRTEQGKEYRIHARRKGSMTAPEEILIDENELADGHDYFRLGFMKPSPNQRYIAYSVDIQGYNHYQFFVKDLQTGQIVDSHITNGRYSLEWAADNQHFFYVLGDHADRDYQVLRHAVGTETSQDELLYQEDDETFRAGISSTPSGDYLLISARASNSSEIRVLDMRDPSATPELMAARQDDVRYQVYHSGDHFYILTDEGALDRKIMRTAVTQPGKPHWRDFIPAQDGVRIEWMFASQGHLAMIKRENSLISVVSYDLASGQETEIALPDGLFSAYMERSNQYLYEEGVFRFRYTSSLTPWTIYEYDFASGQLTMVKQDAAHGYDRSQYVSQRVWVTARDGERIPVSLFYKKGIKLDGSNPMLLTGYGSYGATMDPMFSHTRLSLVDRGFVIVRAHTRGSRAMGERWYRDGKLDKKKNTFMDFIDVAEGLIAAGWTNPEKLAAWGGSAGGLLMGAIANMRPDLFKAVIAHVPFVDVLTTMLDPSIPLTVPEYKEWGNPNEEDPYIYIKSYSPYDQVRAQAYPHMLITSGLFDSQVQYWEPAKWIALLRHMHTGDQTLLLDMKMTAGHGGGSGRYQRLREVALEHAFLLDKLGVN